MCGVLDHDFNAVPFRVRLVCVCGAAERSRKAFTDLVAAESVLLAPICCTGVAWQCEHRRKSQRRGHLGRAQISPGVPRSTGTR